MGLKIEFPCDIGDTVYFAEWFPDWWGDFRSSIHELVVEGFTVKDKKIFGIVKGMACEFGDHLFLTKQEAKKRIEEEKKKHEKV